MKLSRTIPALPVKNIEAGVTFYRERLGFSASFQDESFAVLSRDTAEIHLWAAGDESWQERKGVGSHPIQSGAESFLAGTASCRVQVDGLEQLFQEYRLADVLYDSTTTIQARSWGERVFPVLDLHRNLLTFFEVQPLRSDAE